MQTNAATRKICSKMKVASIHVVLVTLCSIVFGQEELYKDIGKILSQLQGRSANLDHWKIFNLIKNNINALTSDKFKFRNNMRASNDVGQKTDGRTAEEKNIIDIRLISSLGKQCRDSADCQNGKGQHCSEHTCQCNARFVQVNETHCLPGVLLGFACQTHAQCQMRVKHSSCIQGFCRCGEDSVPYRRANCLQGAFLDEKCRTHTQCALKTPGSVCKWIVRNVLGKCQCDINNPRRGNKCGPRGFEVGVSPVSLGKPCHYSSQCKRADPYSTCKDGICSCIVDSPTCSANNTGCFKETFQCISDGRCISAEFVCNGKRDCSDGSDELVCVPGRCSPLVFTCNDGSCVARGKVCDGKPDCPDGSDEQKCIGFSSCPASTFQCGDGRCFPGYTFCNAKLSCDDGSDEDLMACVGGILKTDYCPFRCKNRRCRSASVVCSGKDGCGDNSDEENCSVCNCLAP